MGTLLWTSQKQQSSSRPCSVRLPSGSSPSSPAPYSHLPSLPLFLPPFLPPYSCLPPFTTPPPLPPFSLLPSFLHSYPPFLYYPSLSPSFPPSLFLPPSFYYSSPSPSLPPFCPPLFLPSLPLLPLSFSLLSSLPIPTSHLLLPLPLSLPSFLPSSLLPSLIPTLPPSPLLLSFPIFSSGSLGQ